MKLIFRVKTNDEFVLVDGITFKLPNDEEITIGRNITEYVYEKGYLDMAWKGCYEFVGQKHNYRLSPIMFANAEIVNVLRKEEAPPWYEFDILQFKAES